MLTPNKKRLLDGEIVIAIGMRLYSEFCDNCHSITMEEDEHLQSIRCAKCKKILAYRLHPHKEQGIIEKSFGETVH